MAFEKVVSTVASSVLKWAAMKVAAKADKRAAPTVALWAVNSAASKAAKLVASTVV